MKAAFCSANVGICLTWSVRGNTSKSKSQRKLNLPQVTQFFEVERTSKCACRANSIIMLEFKNALLDIVEFFFKIDKEYLEYRQYLYSPLSGAHPMFSLHNLCGRCIFGSSLSASLLKSVTSCSPTACTLRLQEQKTAGPFLYHSSHVNTLAHKSTNGVRLYSGKIVSETSLINVCIYRECVTTGGIVTQNTAPCQNKKNGFYVVSSHGFYVQFLPLEADAQTNGSGI